MMYPPIGSAPMGLRWQDGDSVFVMTTLQKVMDDQREFAIERDWGVFHTPKNLSMALGGELGELAHAVTDALASPGVQIEISTLDSVTSEIADVTLYLLRLFDVLGCVLPEQQVQDVKRNAAFDREHMILVALSRLVGTVGAILELWQWTDTGQSQAAPAHTSTRITAALDDLADFADMIGVRLVDVASAKLLRNATKYPVSKSFGSSAKYTEFE